MARNPRKARRLAVGSDTFMWSLRHAHQVLDGPRYQDCTERLTLRKTGARAQLVITFDKGPGRLVTDGGLVPSGAVSTGDKWLNLHEPGTVRALLDEALAGGWQPDQPAVEHADGWALFRRAAARRQQPRPTAELTVSARRPAAPSITRWATAGQMTQTRPRRRCLGET